jgi:hypothetical protein
MDINAPFSDGSASHLSAIGGQDRADDVLPHTETVYVYPFYNHVKPIWINIVMAASPAHG